MYLILGVYLVTKSFLWGIIKTSIRRYAIGMPTNRFVSFNLIESVISRTNGFTTDGR